jgi:molybdate transport system ATP-binding protein
VRLELDAISTALLDARLVLARGDLQLDVELQVPPGGVLALLGPNGAGKSTSLQLLAGLLAPAGGYVRVGGELWDDVASGRRVPAEARSVGVVFQDYLLFPRMSARDNVAFGLRARGVDKAAARARADGWLDRVDLGDHGSRRPAELSGGQAQRVALARALATDPLVLLLDEPLAALDAGTRMSVRTDLRRHLDEFAGATVIVTHDPLDALVLADQVVVVEAGRVVQVGTPHDIARRPRTRYVAQLVGLNLLRGRASGTDVALDDGSHWTIAERAEGEVYVVVRPSSVAVHVDRPAGSPRNVWQGQISTLEQHGDLVRLTVAGPPDMFVDVTAEAVADLRLGVGQSIWCSVKATDLTVNLADELRPY